MDAIGNLFQCPWETHSNRLLTARLIPFCPILKLKLTFLNLNLKQWHISCLKVSPIRLEGSYWIDKCLASLNAGTCTGYLYKMLFPKRYLPAFGNWKDSTLKYFTHFSNSSFEMCYDTKIYSGTFNYAPSVSRPR